jgi:hypothetical protein
MEWWRRSNFCSLSRARSDNDEPRDLILKCQNPNVKCQINDKWVVLRPDDCWDVFCFYTYVDNSV